MKAMVITQPGDPSVLQPQEVDAPRPAAEEILVRVRATALNRADLLQRRGLYPPPPGVRADIPGLEFAGEVERCGERVTAWKPGDRVMGLLPGAGYAEHVVTHQNLAMPMPATLGFEEAAAIPEVFLTAYDALVHRLRLQHGERLLIHAVGSGVGTAALQLARKMGVTVFGTAGDPEKLKRAEELGLDVPIHYKSEDFAKVVQDETDGRGVDGILDVVGAAYWSQNLSCLAVLGRLVLVGLLGGIKVEADLFTLMRKRLTVVGTVMRGRSLEEKIALTQEFVRRVLPWFEDGTVRPVVDRVFPLEKAAEAHAYMEANRNFGKIVLRV